MGNVKSQRRNYKLSTPYLLSVSSVPSKLFCLFNSVMSASFAASSASVGRLRLIGGVTPSHWRLCCCAAMSNVVVREVICRGETEFRYCCDDGNPVNLERVSS